MDRKHQIEHMSASSNAEILPERCDAISLPETLGSNSIDVSTFNQLQYLRAYVVGYSTSKAGLSLEREKKKEQAQITVDILRYGELIEKMRQARERCDDVANPMEASPAKKVADTCARIVCLDWLIEDGDSEDSDGYRQAA